MEKWCFVKKFSNYLLENFEKKDILMSGIFQNNLTKMIQVKKNDSIVDIIQKMKDEKWEKISFFFIFKEKNGIL